MHLFGALETHVTKIMWVIQTTHTAHTLISDEPLEELQTFSIYQPFLNNFQNFNSPYKTPTPSQSERYTMFFHSRPFVVYSFRLLHVQVLFQIKLKETTFQDCYLTAELPSISRPSPKYNSTDWESSVSGDPNSRHALSLSFTTKQPIISRPFPEYNSRTQEPFLGRPENTMSSLFSSVTTELPAILRPSPKYNSTDTKNSVLAQV